MPLKDVPVKQIHPYLNIYQAQNYHVPLCKNENYYPGLPVHRHCPSMDMLECQLRQPNTAEPLASQGESHQLWTQQLLCLAMSLLDIYFYRILSTQRTITNHIHTFMLNSLFCGLTFVYNGHTHASMVIFRFSILVYYLAIRSNYSSFKYGHAPVLPFFSLDSLSPLLSLHCLQCSDSSKALSQCFWTKGQVANWSAQYTANTLVVFFSFSNTHTYPFLYALS